jgi:hypothetical protein
LKEIDVLFWAAGAETHLPSLDVIDQDQLYDLITLNRLTQRFCDRLCKQERRFALWGPSKIDRENLGNWRNSLLIKMLRKRKDEDYILAKRQIKAVNEIVQSAPKDLLIINLKGFSHYALTGDLKKLRYSSDIDLLPNDPSVMCQLLKELGYDILRGFGQHEYAIASRDDIKIEVHAYFTVVSPQKESSQENLNPANFPKQWIQDLSLVEHQICFNDLMGEAVYGKTKSTDRILFPNIYQLSFILTAHLYAPYSFSWAKRPHLDKLGELAALRELFQSADFEKSKYLKYISLFHGECSFRFVNKLLSIVYNDDDDTCSMLALPQRIVGHSSIKFGLHSKIIDKNIFNKSSISYYVEYLGCNDVIATNGDEQSIAPLTRVICDKKIAKMRTPNILVHWTNKRLQFNLQIEDLMCNNSSLYVEFLFSDKSRVWTKITLLDENIKTVGNTDILQTKFTNSSTFIALDIPWDRIGETATNSTQSVLLSIEKSHIVSPSYREAREYIAIFPIKISKPITA